jgi:hypothetical protein
MIRGWISDISAGGLYLNAAASIVPIGSPVSVTFQPEQGISDDCLTLNGHVVHQSPDGVGIAFDSLSESCLQAIAGLLPSLPVHPMSLTRMPTPAA